jgi:hypothetical protein
VDFVLFLGIPVALMSGRTLLLSLFPPGPQARSQGLVQARFLLAALATLVILDVAGLNRGETARLWMPFMPFFCVNAPTSVPSGHRPAGASSPALIALMAAQFAQLCAFKLCLDVFGLSSLMR